MATILSRKNFIRRVTIPSNQSITYLGLMQLAPATMDNPVWGQNADGSPSMDSTQGDGASIIPQSGVLYVGGSSGVSAVNSASTYIGVPTQAGQSFSLTDYWPCPIDIGSIWLYSVNAQDCDIIYQGRT